MNKIKMIYTILHTFLNYASHCYEAAQIDQVIQPIDKICTDNLHGQAFLDPTVPIEGQSQVPPFLLNGRAAENDMHFR